MQLHDANGRIGDQKQQLKEQKELIDQKVAFGAAMQGLLDAAGKFDGVLVASVVPFDSYQSVAERSWYHRWNPAALDRDIATVLGDTDDLVALLATAGTEAATNSTGSTYEAVIDRLGAGFATSVIDDADTLCEQDVLACVVSDDPTTVHFDAADSSLPYMNDWLKTGLAYHEFAHVLQFANPVATEVAVKAFDGDDETMADCFALTYLDGWALDHRVFVNRYQYWDVSIGYGYTCNETQKQAVRDWYGGLGFHAGPISQEH